MGNIQVMLTEDELRKRAHDKYSNRSPKDNFRIINGGASTQKNEEYDDYENARHDTKDRLKGNSTSGATGRRKTKFIRISESEYMHRLKYIALKTADVTSIAIGVVGYGGSHIASSVNEFFVESSIQNELQKDFSPIVTSNTHRTEDNQHYWYDYAKIASRMKDYDNYDLAVLSCYLDLGKKQTNRVMNYSEYRSFDAYLQQKGFVDAKEYKETMIDQIRLQRDLDKEQEELNKMRLEHDINVETKTEGASYHG